MFIFNNYFNSFNFKNHYNFKKNFNFVNYSCLNTDAVHTIMLIFSFSFYFYFFSPLLYKYIFKKNLTLNSFLLFFINKKSLDNVIIK